MSEHENQKNELFYLIGSGCTRDSRESSTATIVLLVCHQCCRSSRAPNSTGDRVAGGQGRRSSGAQPPSRLDTAAVSSMGYRRRIHVNVVSSWTSGRGVIPSRFGSSRVVRIARSRWSGVVTLVRPPDCGRRNTGIQGGAGCRDRTLLLRTRWSIVTCSVIDKFHF